MPRVRVASRARHYDNPTYLAMLAAIRRRLAGMRTALGWTMEQAADRCGLLYQNYQAIEAGKVNVTLVTLARLCDGFGATMDELWRPGPDAIVPGAWHRTRAQPPARSATKATSRAGTRRAKR